jgi:succinyl-CoA synthetase beta subunit
VAIKAQILAGGRGKSGGIKFADTPEEAENASRTLLGSKIQGLTVNRVLVEEKLNVFKEYYVGITVDRSKKSYVAIASSRGGVDIEEVVKKTPNEVIIRSLDSARALEGFEAKEMAASIGCRGKALLSVAQALVSLVSRAMTLDAETFEINPLVETREGDFIAADARLVIDDNALYRHPDMAKILDESEELSADELRARKRDLVYVELDGDIGILGNGAGLVMATLDLVHFYGGRPANFLDIGGGATMDRVAYGLDILLSNPRVRVVLINVLGGITRCDEVAKGILDVRRRLKSTKPMVIRMVGTNEQAGRLLLGGEGIPVADSMDEVAREAVRLSRLS